MYSGILILSIYLIVELSVFLQTGLWGNIWRPHWPCSTGDFSHVFIPWLCLKFDSCADGTNRFINGFDAALLSIFHFTAGLGTLFQSIFLYLDFTSLGSAAIYLAILASFTGQSLRNASLGELFTIDRWISSVLTDPINSATGKE